MGTIDKEGLDRFMNLSDQVMNNAQPFCIWVNPKRTRIFNHLKKKSASITGLDPHTDIWIDHAGELVYFLIILNMLGPMTCRCKGYTK